VPADIRSSPVQVVGYASVSRKVTTCPINPTVKISAHPF
jgi:hypothetical protein